VICFSIKIWYVRQYVCRNISQELDKLISAKNSHNCELFVPQVVYTYTYISSTSDVVPSGLLPQPVAMQPSVPEAWFPPLPITADLFTEAGGCCYISGPVVGVRSVRLSRCRCTEALRHSLEAGVGIKDARRRSSLDVGLAGSGSRRLSVKNAGCPDIDRPVRDFTSRGQRGTSAGGSGDGDVWQREEDGRREVDDGGQRRRAVL